VDAYAGYVAQVVQTATPRTANDRTRGRRR
jgi:hypothetical protein